MASTPSIFAPLDASGPASSSGNLRYTILIKLDNAASSAATAIKPVGPAPKETVAMMTPTAAGSSRRVAMARSMHTHVNSAPNAITGSGRRPLL